MTFIWGFLSGTACAWALFVAIVWYINSMFEQEERERVVANHQQIEKMLDTMPRPNNHAHSDKEDSPSRGTSGP